MANCHGVRANLTINCETNHLDGGPCYRLKSSSVGQNLTPAKFSRMSPELDMQ